MKLPQLITVLLLFIGISSFGQCIKGDCIDGYGTFVYEDLTFYVGDFKNNLPDGSGICYYKDGSTYVGQWKANTFEGEGIYYHKDGSLTSGIWNNNFYVGPLKEQAVDKTPPKIWAVIIGASSYENYPSLRYSDNDAHQFNVFLLSNEGGAVPDNQIRTYIDESATKHKVMHGIKEITGMANENDMVMVYFSGHGERDGLLLYDTNGETNKLYYDEIKTVLDESKSKFKFFVLDACHSGSAENVFQLKGVDQFEDSVYDFFSTSEGGTAMLLSSKSAEKSVEVDGLRHGVFTYYIIKGLKGHANVDNDDFISIEELYNYVHGQVTQYTNFNQTPSLIGNFDPTTPIGQIID